jgi:nucleotide-binding universal stress UspA family protein
MTEILVGVDESEGAAQALRWALREGELRRADVTAVLAWGWLDQHQATPAAFDPHYDEPQARAALEAIVAKVLGGPPPAALRLEVICDLAAPALIKRSAGADLLVVGARGLGGFRSLLVGSISQQVLQHAPCPVAVVRGEPATRDQERVLVGIDGSRDAGRALSWAVEEARARGAALTVLHAYLPPYAGNLEVAWDPGDEKDAARAVLDEAIDTVDLSAMPAPVESALVCDRAATAILRAAEDADLVVVGSRGRGGFAGLLLGSVSQQVTHHAPCPVVVLRRADSSKG